jgi:hypothetical protein
MVIGRALFGLLKGLLVGGAIGYCLLKLGNPENFLIYLCCGIVGAVVGVICGRAPWHAETIWTPIIKMIFGFAAGAGLFALGHRFLPGLTIPLQGFAPAAKLNTGGLLAPLIGGLYGLFVEVDDGGSSGSSPKPKTPAKAKAKALPAVELEP